MKSLASFFTVAAGVFAVVPGLATLISKVGVPPDSSSTLFSAVIESLGVLTLMILWLNKGRIQKKSEQKVTNLSIGGIVFFLVSLFSYIFLYNYLIEDVPNSRPLYFPLWAQGELKTDLVKYGTRNELITQFGRDDVAKLIQESSKQALSITTLVLLFLYQLIFVPLTFSFGILAVKSINSEPKSRP
ncbi:MAG: hypothetical protein V4577_24100 [Bacteroidota bacterium]